MPIMVEFAGPKQVRVITYEREPLPAGYVRVRTHYSGISAGTELTAYRGTNPYLTRVWDPDARLFHDGEGGITYPIAGWGYSEVGEIIEGPGTGDLVCGIWGHRSEAVVPDAVTRLPATVDPLSASFARVGAIAFNAILSAGIRLGETVAVFGQGVLGLLVTRLATLSGGSVVAVDTIAKRREAALRYGAAAALVPHNAAAEIRRRTAGRGADVAIEISGAYAALHEAVRAVAPGARVVASGFYQGDGVGLRLGEEFHHNRVQLVCSQIGGVPPELAPRWSPARLQEAFLAQVAAGAVDARGLVSHLVPATEAASAYELLDERPEEALQVILDFTT
ncbi:zinc-dependent alcohol dehydrogenase [Virgisporangium aurantiacum]|uniref:Oxidoreductase n=1 Tax=Virgisporangium aurantiacum TaxID=175570 RepID=A0A8J4DWE2_9ACTN|nr:zinc-binding alcohol dehydrogenase [Virgisporangium aurantiacum]GIJ53365.1 oxidoreductase [Virgisporangium aurantiacum]